jgi:hypothetical protein
MQLHHCLPRRLRRYPKLAFMASALALGLAFGLMGAPAASASGDLLVANERTICVPNAPHNTSVNMISYSSYCAKISYINEYTTPNGSAWYELKLGNGFCLNWQSATEVILADDCIAGDANELFYTHVSGQLTGRAATGRTTRDGQRGGPSTPISQQQGRSAAATARFRTSMPLAGAAYSGEMNMTGMTPGFSLFRTTAAYILSWQHLTPSLGGAIPDLTRVGLVRIFANVDGARAPSAIRPESASKADDTAQRCRLVPL